MPVATAASTLHPGAVRRRAGRAPEAFKSFSRARQNQVWAHQEQRSGAGYSNAATDSHLDTHAAGSGGGADEAEQHVASQYAIASGQVISPSPSSEFIHSCASPHV